MHPIVYHTFLNKTISHLLDPVFLVFAYLFCDLLLAFTRVEWLSVPPGPSNAL